VKSLIEVPVVLASSSPRRRDLLNLVGISHKVHAADADESYRAREEPVDHADRLARLKAETVLALHPDSLVIGADTIVVVDENILGKPRDEADAARMLGMLSGRTHNVITAVAVAWKGRVVSTTEEVSVTFRRLTPDEISTYVATGEPMDKAGAYGIQGYGATIVRRIEGDYFAVMGLSLVRLIELMGEVGVRYGFGR